MRWSGWWRVSLGLVIFAAPAECLARVPTRLVSARSPSAVDCPDEPALTSAVAARLGYDPFSPWGDQTILASVSRSSAGLVAQAELIDHDGIARGSREVKAADNDCGELILSLALAISITLDPFHVPPTVARVPDAEPLPPAEAESTVASDDDSVSPPVEPEKESTPALDRAPARRPTRPAALSWHARASAFSALGLAPDMSFGGRLGGELRRDRWSVGLEGWASLPSTSAVAGGGAIETSLWAAALVPCFNVLRYTHFCALGSLGSLATAGRDIGAPRSERVLHATAGGRVSASWPLGSRLELLAAVDVTAVLTRPRFQLDGDEVWRPSRLISALGVGASVRIF